MPIIFSLTEDSLASIPQALPASSLALGASRWQTVWAGGVAFCQSGNFCRRDYWFWASDWGDDDRIDGDW